MHFVENQNAKNSKKANTVFYLHSFTFPFLVKKLSEMKFSYV